MPILLTIAGGLSYVSAVFHADGEHASTTLHGQIHQTAGIVTFILIVIAMLAGARAFHRNERWRSLTKATLTCATVAIVAFLLTPAVSGTYFGVVQRVFLADALGWLLLVAIHGRSEAIRHGEHSAKPAYIGQILDHQ